MRKHWNDTDNQAAYLWIFNDAMTTRGFSKATLYPENLSNLNLKTRSSRIDKMIKLAYYLGQLRGVMIADEFKDTYSFMESKVGKEMEDET